MSPEREEPPLDRAALGETQALSGRDLETNRNPALLPASTDRVTVSGPFTTTVFGVPGIDWREIEEHAIGAARAAKYQAVVLEELSHDEVVDEVLHAVTEVFVDHEVSELSGRCSRVIVAALRAVRFDVVAIGAK